MAAWHRHERHPWYQSRKCSHLKVLKPFSVRSCSCKHIQRTDHVAWNDSDWQKGAGHRVSRHLAPTLHDFEVSLSCQRSQNWKNSTEGREICMAFSCFLWDVQDMTQAARQWTLRDVRRSGATVINFTRDLRKTQPRKGAWICRLAREVSTSWEASNKSLHVQPPFLKCPFLEPPFLIKARATLTKPLQTLDGYFDEESVLSTSPTVLPVSPKWHQTSGK